MNDYTLIELGNNRVLSIRTSKVGKMLTTTAMVESRNASGLMTFVVAGSGGDFFKRLASAPVRATAKAIERQHAEALAKLDVIKADVAAHYEAIRLAEMEESI